MDGCNANLRRWIFRLACVAASAGDPRVAAAASVAEAARTDRIEPSTAEFQEPGLPPTAAPDRRFYVTGMLGSSLEGVAGAASGGPSSAASLAGDGAAGVSVARPLGAVRLELEGHAARAIAGAPSEADGGSGRWFTSANLWRDVRVEEHLGCYAGAGIGVGGDRALPGNAGLAWQAGGGVTYEVSPRVTFDLGYRVRGLETGAAAGSGSVDGVVLMAVRVFEPFRGWLGEQRGR